MTRWVLGTNPSTSVVTKVSLLGSEFVLRQDLRDDVPVLSPIHSMLEVRPFHMLDYKISNQSRIGLVTYLAQFRQLRDNTPLLCENYCMILFPFMCKRIVDLKLFI